MTLIKPQKEVLKARYIKSASKPIAPRRDDSQHRGNWGSFLICPNGAKKVINHKLRKQKFTRNEVVFFQSFLN